MPERFPTGAFMRRYTLLNQPGFVVCAGIEVSFDCFVEHVGNISDLRIFRNSVIVVSFDVFVEDVSIHWAR